MPNRHQVDLIETMLGMSFAKPYSPAPWCRTMPRRSPAEGAIAQAMVGLDGITIGQYGSIAVDPLRVDPLAPVVTDLTHDAFTGFRTFLTHAAAARAKPMSSSSRKAGAPSRSIVSRCRACVRCM